MHGQSPLLELPSTYVKSKLIEMNEIPRMRQKKMHTILLDILVNILKERHFKIGKFYFVKLKWNRAAELRYAATRAEFI